MVSVNVVIFGKSESWENRQMCKRKERGDR